MSIGNCAASDIVAIASAGFMGLAAAIIVGVLVTSRTPPTKVLVTCIVVLVIGAAAQLIDKWMQYIVHPEHWVTVSIQPPPNTFDIYFSTDDAAPVALQSKPYIWLAAGPPNCQPGDGYDGKNCPSFDRAFLLLSGGDTIEVSVAAIMRELRGRVTELAQRLKKAQIAGTQLAAAQAQTQPKTELPFSQDLGPSAGGR